MSKILFIGDVVGKPGRNALARVLPLWKEKYQPDVVIVNVENLAHGKGVTLSTLAEIKALGVDAMTSGNHIFKKAQYVDECFEKYPELIRPTNFAGMHSGHGYYRFSKGITPSSVPAGAGTPSPEGEKVIMNSATQQYLVVNINGQVFMENQFDGEIDNPFLSMDKVLQQEAQKGDIIIVDFHAEATSEKIAMGWYLDGRVSALFGTHTHVPTADARVLTQGTGYVTDAGMTGSLESVIGVKKENVLKKFLEQGKFINELEEEGLLQVNGVLIEVLDNSKTTTITKLYQEISN